MSINNSGYHYTAGNRGKPDHILAAERALGRKLKGTEEVHHVDENRLNNSNSNLVICPDRAYHMLLHVRARAFDACGDASKRKCQFCQQYDTKANLVGSGRLNNAGEYSSFRHRACQNKYWHDRGYANRPNFYLKKPASEARSKVLTWEKVREMRKLYATGAYSQVKLGTMFGVSNVMVAKVVHNEYWRET